MHVVIVGAGPAGSSAAYFLARAGAKVTLKLVGEELRQVPRRALERVKARVPFFGGRAGEGERVG